MTALLAPSLQKFLDLDTSYREQRTNFSDDFRLRIHRALSWAKKANSSISEDGADLDMVFMSLWISFNAAYAKDMNTLSPADRNNFREFLQLICSLDNEQKMYKLVWTTFPKSIRLLLDNPFVFQPFWDFHNGKITETEWQSLFSEAKQQANQALATQETGHLLFIIFDRLYTLRNQIVHGGSTYGSKANRTQLEDACQFLSHCLAAILEVMMQNPRDKLWGKPFYPYIGE